MAAKVLILAGYGLNCEEETRFAFVRAGLTGTIRHINDLIDNPQELESMQVLAVPGGFSYGDDTGSGNAFAQKMKLSLWDHLRRFVERDTLTIGICNGCQILTKLGQTPPAGSAWGERLLAVTYNLTARYQCRWIDLKVDSDKSPWLKGLNALHIPVAHGEGRFMMGDDVLKTIQKNGQVALQYIKRPPPSPLLLQAGGKVKRGEEVQAASGEFPFNPYGSLAAIAGVTDASGRVLALMPHPERGMFTWQRDDYDRLKDRAQREGREPSEESDGMALFRNAAGYFS